MPEEPKDGTHQDNYVTAHLPMCSMTPVHELPQPQTQTLPPRKTSTSACEPYGSLCMILSYDRHHRLIVAHATHSATCPISPPHCCSHHNRQQFFCCYCGPSKMWMVRPLNLKPLAFPNCSTPPPSRSIAPDLNLRILGLHLKQHGYPTPWAKKCMPLFQISSEGFIKPNIMKWLFSNCQKLNHAPQKPSARPHHLTRMRQMANQRLQLPLSATSPAPPLSH